MTNSYSICSECLYVVQCLSHLLIRYVCNEIEPIVNHSEESLPGIGFYQISKNVFCILHVYLKQLNSFSLSLHSLKHLTIQQLAQIRSPLIGILGPNHSSEDNLSEDEQILMCKEYQVF